MLGCWIGPKKGLMNRKKRAGYLWAKCRSQLLKSKLPRKKQAQVVQACVESGLLFDCATRPWYNQEINNIQSWIDKRYRYPWSNKKGPPLKQMHYEGVNMQDNRNMYDIISLRWKIEKRTLERIGHILRMSNARTVKMAVLGWLGSLEEIQKRPGYKQKTIFYWRKLLKEAGINWTEAPKFALERKEWKRRIKIRMDHLEKWEYQQGNRHDGEEKLEKRNFDLPREKVCKSVGGLNIHIKRMHTEASHSFTCSRCQKTWKTEGPYKNHVKVCNPQEAEKPRKYIAKKKECSKCNRTLSATNMAKHTDRCRGRGHGSNEPNA